MLTGLALGCGGWFLGGWIGGWMAVHHDYLQSATSCNGCGGTDQNDVGIYMGYLFAVIGWLVGLGFLNYPIARLRGRPPSMKHHETTSWTRYSAEPSGTEPTCRKPTMTSSGFTPSASFTTSLLASASVRHIEP